MSTCLRQKTGNTQAAARVASQGCRTSVEQAAEQTAADTPDNGAPFTVNGISAGSASAGSNYLPGRAGSKQQQRKDRAN
jgi:hypothetical protein